MTSDDATAKRIRRRRRVVQTLEAALPAVACVLFAAGALVFLAVPLSSVGRGTYISENAIQPAQVNTYWGWNEVHEADTHAAAVDEWTSDPHRRVSDIATIFERAGLAWRTQTYLSHSGRNGTNVFATVRGSKTDGAESVLVAASWLSRAGGVNVRGVSTVLALARFFARSSLWSKDIVLLISDGYADGAAAWASAQVGDLVPAPSLDAGAGPPWAALWLDYPYHSFSRIDMFYEGVDGLLPNLDYINTVRHIARWAGGCDAVPHHYTAEEASSSPRAYIDALGGLVTHARTQASGAVHGPEAVFARYGVDSMALYAVPAEGPHGFYSIGRTTESTLRSLNNLLERFHQSFFLYSLVAPDRFVSVGTYVASPILASAALTFLGLRGAATSSSLRPALLVGLASLALGAIVMALRMPLGVVGVCAVAIASRTLRPTARVDPAVVRLEAGVVIAVAAAVNFGRGALLAAAIGPALLAVASRAPIRLAGLSSTALAVYLVDVRAAATPFAGLVVAPLLAQTFAAALYK